MTLVVPDEIAASAYEITASTGDSHYPPISPELQAEFDAWEEISDETTRRMDELEDLGWHEPKSASAELNK